MQSKIPFLSDFAYEHSIEILALTESHLSQDTMDSEISISGYNIHRSDRVDRSHGGAIIYIKDDLSCKILIEYSHTFCSSLVIHIMDYDSIIGLVYRPPNCQTQSFNNCLSTIIKSWSNLETPTPNLILTGDFNLPKVTWSD